MTIRAAGVLFLTDDGRALFLKRGPGSDHPGEWCLPGGRVEGSETAAEAAAREALEETGREVAPAGLAELTRQVTPPAPPGPCPCCGAMPCACSSSCPNCSCHVPAEAVDYTTFVSRLPAPFEPKPDDEHTAFAWAPPADPPAPLHPGCAVALERLTMDELGIAQAMAAGRLTSPQVYRNVTLWLMRVTGTGMAYRDRVGEYVWRDPAIYMNDEFLARCNGLPVVMHHPEKRATLDSKEFNDRVVGTVFLPFLRPEAEEAWAVTKVWDAAANAMLATIDPDGNGLSTSPGVVLGDGDEKFEFQGRPPLLVEGKPRLLDHLAICEVGVWDKRGDPAGVEVVMNDSNGGAAMADEREEDKKEEAKADAAEETGDKKEEAKNDADAGDKLDKVLAGLDAMGARMDRQDARMDAMGARMDAGKKDDDEEPSKEGDGAAAATDKKDGRKDDAEDLAEAKAKQGAAKNDEDKKEAEEARADAAAVRVELNKVRERLTAMERGRTDEDRAALSEIQARADSAYGHLGRSASAPMTAETAVDYRVRMAKGLQSFSNRFKDVNLYHVAADSALFDTVEDSIYNDAAAYAAHPTDLQAGELRPIVRSDETGRRVTTFAGEPKSWMRDFAGQARRVNRIRNAAA